MKLETLLNSYASADREEVLVFFEEVESIAYNPLLISLDPHDPTHNVIRYFLKGNTVDDFGIDLKGDVYWQGENVALIALYWDGSVVSAKGVRSK